MKDGDIVLRFEAGFPANGRTINARELEKMLFDILPDCVRKSLYYVKIDKERLRQAICLCEDQQYIRKSHCGAEALCFHRGRLHPAQREWRVGEADEGRRGFPFPGVAAGHIVPAEQGPGERGWEFRQGITLFVGGGYHGKSTILQALQNGVYNHIAGVRKGSLSLRRRLPSKLRAEDGRSVTGVDISPFY